MNVAELEQQVKQKLPSIGPNKLRELVRLVYEIAKREQMDPREPTLHSATARSKLSSELVTSVTSIE